MRNVLALAFGWAMATGATAQLSQDAAAAPARWGIEDATPNARYQTLKKEADAGYRENLAQCKTLPSQERSACLKEAKNIHLQDLKLAKDALRPDR